MRGVDKLLTVFFIFLVFISYAGYIYAEGTSAGSSDASKAKLLEQKDVYNFGLNIDEFLESSYARQNDIIRDPALFESFLKGVRKSIEENPDKIFGAMVMNKKNEKGEVQSALGDEVKNKIWESFGSNINDYAKKIINRAFDEKHKGVRWTYQTDSSGRRSFVAKQISGDAIEKVIVEGGELKWKGNKLGVMDKNGNLVLWVDMDNLPNWLTSLEFKDGKFNMGFDTGNGYKNVIFSSGSIGFVGELIGPDGKKIGTNFNEGLQGIKYENNQFTCSYIFDGKERTVTLKESDLNPQLVGKLKELLNNPLLGNDFKQVLGSLSLSNKGEIGSFVGIPINNQINVLFGGNYNTPEIIEIDYKDGNPTIQSSNGGIVVTTDYKGGVDAIYAQWYSKQAGNTARDEKSVMLFNKYGELKAAQNTMIGIVGMGIAYTSRSEMIGVNIVKNTFVDALFRDDLKTVADAFLFKTDMFERQLTNEPIDEIAEAIKVAREQLADPGLKVELRNQLSNALDSILKTSLESSAETSIDYLLFGARDFSSKPLTVDEERIKDYTFGLTVKETRDAMSDLLSNPEKAKVVLKGGPESTQFLKNYLKERLSTESAKSFVNNEFVRSVISSVNDARTTMGKDKINFDYTEKEAAELANLIVDGIKPDEIKTDGIKVEMFPPFSLKKIIENSFKQISGSSSDFLTTMVKERLNTREHAGLSEDEKQKILESVKSITSEVGSRIDQEKEKLKQNVMQNLFEKEYPNRIIIDTGMKEVKTSGNGQIVFDAYRPLNKFSVSNTGSDVYNSYTELWANGKRVLRFSGAQTYGDRLVKGASYVPINSIVNEMQRGNNEYKLAQSSWGGYVIYDKMMNVVKGNYNQPGLGIKDMEVPIIGNLHIEVPFKASTSLIRGPIEGDIGIDPSAQLVITALMEPQATGFGKRLKNWGFRQEAAKGSPMSKMTAGMKQKVAEMYSKQVASAGGPEAFSLKLAQSVQQLNMFTQMGVKVPQKVWDGVYVGQNIQEFNKVFAFFESQTLKPGTKVIMTNSYVQVGNNRFTEANPAVFREMLRNIQKDPSFLTKPVVEKK